MASYEVQLRESVVKTLARLPKRDVRRITKAIGGFARDPRPPGCKKLSGEEKYRLRQGNYRILYQIHDKVLEVWVVRVAHRKEVYR